MFWIVMAAYLKLKMNENDYAPSPNAVIFNVRFVYGGMLIGDLENENGMKIEDPKNPYFRLRLDQLSQYFKENGLQLHDLADYFRVGDRFRIENQGNGQMKIEGLDVAEFRKRSFQAPSSISNTYKSGLGYIVDIQPEGFLVWSDFEGGSLVFAPMESICSGNIPPPIKDLETMTPVAVIIDSTPLQTDQSHLPRLTVPAYGCISLHYIKSQLTATYFPDYRVEGVIMCILENGGAVLGVGSGNQFPRNLNHPALSTDSRVYCPPWSFVNAKIAGLRWTSHCRLGGTYHCRVVFIRDDGYAYGCPWIALLNKEGKSHNRTVTCYQQERFDSGIKDHHLAAYKLREEKDTKLNKWNVDECQRKIESLWLDQANGNDVITEFTDHRLCKNFEMLTTFLQHYKEPVSDNGDGISATQNYRISSKNGRSRLSSATQTLIDGKFFDEVKGWLRSLPTGLTPENLEQFWLRFEDLKPLCD